MSSKAFQGIENRRTPPNTRRARIKGHLYELPYEKRGHQEVTLPGGVHVEDCPQCMVEQNAQ